MDDFRGPTGDGRRLVLDVDAESRLLFPEEGKEPLRHSSSTSAPSASLNSVSDGRMRIGGTVVSPVLGAAAG